MIVVPTTKDLATKKPTRKQLAEWGVPWPPPKGWKRRLIKQARSMDWGEKKPEKPSGKNLHCGELFEAPKWLAKYADEMRNKPTRAEKHLAEELEACGFTVFQQFPVDSYILDFFIPEKMLAIEADGLYHYTPEQWDKDFKRTSRLWSNKRIRVLRFDNDEIQRNARAVVSKIIKFCEL